MDAFFTGLGSIVVVDCVIVTGRIDFMEGMGEKGCLGALFFWTGSGLEMADVM
jgi:hypothetical protein